MRNNTTQRRSSSIPLLSILLLLLVSLSLPSPSHSFGSGNGNKGPSFKVRVAELPADLPAIQDCRRSAYDGKPAPNLSAAKSFCNADQIQKEGYVCVIAVDKKTVLGTADLNTRTRVVNNVYVREDARKRGIANLMMEAVEDALVERPSTLKLMVQSKNIPAVSLYKKMGFQAPGVYGGLDALSSVTPLDFLMEMEKKL